MLKGKVGVKELLDHISSGISGYDAREKQSIVYWVTEEVTGLTYTEIVAEKPITLSDHDRMLIADAISRLNSGEPVQYIFGRAWFRGLSFRVGPEVLIPRPETEELVEFILAEDADNGQSLLDIGTGSGCIPISLALERPSWSVSAMDISREALAVAKGNAMNLNTHVTFIEVDVLEDNLPGKYDIIVSNPPYIPESESSDLEVRVRDHEPSVALFVPDDDPLKFYRRIAELARDSLNPGGKLYFEVHFQFGSSIKDMLMEMDFADVQLLQDLNGMDRMVRAVRV